MNDAQARENDLKLVMSDMGPVSNPLRFRAEMTLSIHKENLKDLSYDDAIKLADDADVQIKLCGPFDPAYNYLVNSRDIYLKWASALNVVNTLGRRDHEIKIHAMICVDETTIECDFYIDRLHYSDTRRNTIIQNAIRERLAASSQWRGAMRRPITIDYVEL